MVEFRWIKMSLFLIVLLHLTAAEVPFYTGRVEDDVTLPCENVIDDQNNCDSTTWLFSSSARAHSKVLFTAGQSVAEDKSKSDRLNVTDKCSLVIKKVTDDDVGKYSCRQHKSSRRIPDTVVYLSVVTLDEHVADGRVTLRCSVKTYEQCTHTAEWLFEGKEVDKDNRDMRTSQSPCYASVAFDTSLSIYTSRYELFKCEVTDGVKVHQFSFRSQTSGKETKTVTTESTTENNITAGANDASPKLKGEETKTATTESTTENNISAGANDASPKLDLWVYIIVAVALAALFILIVAIITWRRNKGKKTQKNDTHVLTANPAVTKSAPEASQDTADPEDGVSYASVSYTKTTKIKAQVQSKYDDDDGDAVTYSTVKTSSVEPSSLYATIN